MKKNNVPRVSFYNYKAYQIGKKPPYSIFNGIRNIIKITIPFYIKLIVQTTKEVIQEILDDPINAILDVIPNFEYIIDKVIIRDRIPKEKTVDDLFDEQLKEFEEKVKDKLG